MKFFMILGKLFPDFSFVLLYFLVVLGFDLVDPQQSNAILYRRYWKAQQKMLQDYLINYKTSGTYSGCIRNGNFPNGYPAGS